MFLQTPSCAVRLAVVGQQKQHTPLWQTEHVWKDNEYSLACFSNTLHFASHKQHVSSAPAAAAVLLSAFKARITLSVTGLRRPRTEIEGAKKEAQMWRKRAHERERDTTERHAERHAERHTDTRNQRARTSSTIISLFAHLRLASWSHERCLFSSFFPLE